ncbi:MAG: haloacid dehalogenase type II [Gammaproteobacteria bacterium]|nr:haloacid dehalogenase type II [Gammaproteobacteria bacterium]
MHTKPATKALLFDVFGTVLDWRTSIVEELAAFGNTHSIELDCEAVADRWRVGFRDHQRKIAQDAAPFMRMDDVHRRVLDRLFAGLGVAGVPEANLQELNQAWHRLRPWPDAVAGLTRLKERYTVAALSNGNLSMLVGVSKYAGLPWDCVFSTAMFSAYKPDPAVYWGAAKMLEAPPHEAMMVAAHAYDVDAAREIGLQTAYVFRADEFGPGQGEDPGDTSRFDFAVGDLLELADALA